MVVINISKKAEFEDTVSSNDLAVVHFYAEWATQCGPMNDVLEELAKQAELKPREYYTVFEYRSELIAVMEKFAENENIKSETTINQDVKFAKCPAEDLPDISLKYNVSAVPTFLLLRGGSLLDRVDGANAAELTKKINVQVSKGSSGVSVPSIPAAAPQDLTSRLRELVNAAPVMLFMKGSAAEPRCGFSKSIIALLDSHDAVYKTFDILNDDEVRQGLKTFSNWPTYPQLYINGELIGGLDIVKEMNESGELKTLLPKKQALEDRLKSLINQNHCMVFMKGSRTAPRCGFSRQLMEILGQIDIEFDTFDILSDEDVRQGLKTFSNWPTYPQVYVKGELVGGLDIIKELKESGDLSNTLKGEP